MKKDKDELREDALRPSAFLGYDRDSVAMHLVSRGAYDIAESQLRRAIWLNPYEAVFKQHLAWCMFKAERFQEAKEWIDKALEQAPEDEDFNKMLSLINRRLQGGGSTKPKP